MSSYFDDFDAAVRGIFIEHEGDSKKILEEYGQLEVAMINLISAAVGDREFPADLRERILRVIAKRRVFVPKGEPTNTRAADSLLAMHMSFLSSELHSAFHEVASRRVETRFGFLSDSPEGIVRRRDAHDSGEDDDGDEL